MNTKRRICRLADSNYRKVDLRDFKEIIISTVNDTVIHNNHNTKRRLTILIASLSF